MRFCLILLFTLIPSLLTLAAQTFQITEISPHKVGDLEEWFEFRVEGEVDLSQYRVSNAKNLPKSLEKALPGTTPGYYYFEKSPVSLANDGGEIQILDSEDNIITEAVYPKTKSGTTKDYKWAEIWNWSDDFRQFIPLLYRSNRDPVFAHTRGTINHKLPTPNERFVLLFSEASPDQDFLEFYVVDGPDEINLKYAQFKHNGSTVRQFESDHIVSPGDFILFEASVSGGSGTVEVILNGDTSLEKRADAVCWQNETLSKTEADRVEKFIQAGDWQGHCYSLAESIKNESVARLDSNQDTNTALDLWRHFNGSPGEINAPQNQPPQAKITIQGSGKTVGHPPFSLNVTGESSLDPDGIKDLKAFQWYLNDRLFSEAANPLNYKIESLGQYELRLVIEDHSGAKSEAVQIIVVQSKASAPTVKNKLSLKDFVAAVPITNLDNTNVATPLVNNWFAPVLENAVFINRLRYPLAEDSTQTPIVPNITPPLNLNRRIILPAEVRKRLRRNLGLIWDWRERQWAGGVGLISDVAIDQNSERFLAAFGAP